MVNFINTVKPRFQVNITNLWKFSRNGSWFQVIASVVMVLVITMLITVNCSGHNCHRFSPSSTPCVCVWREKLLFFFFLLVPATAFFLQFCFIVFTIRKLPWKPLDNYGNSSQPLCLTDGGVGKNHRSHPMMKRLLSTPREGKRENSWRQSLPVGARERMKLMSDWQGRQYFHSFM